MGNGEKPFSCIICEKSFALKTGLNTHMVVHTGEKPFSCDKCGKLFAVQSNCNRHKKKCKEQTLQQNDSATTSGIQFVDCSETIKQEVKEERESEDEINPLDYVQSEFCEDIDENGEISLESELQVESIDCKETIKLEIKHEIQETTEDLEDPLFNEDLISTNVEYESFGVKMENDF